MLLLSRSFRRKLLATALGAASVLLLRQAVVIDSRNIDGVAPTSTGRIQVIATAYCKGQTTASGVAPQAGVAAADPEILPEGSVVRLEGLPAEHRGIYTVLDTGPKIIGRHVDLYMWSCNEALAFGRRPVTVTILRLGWNPANSAGGPAKHGD
jgi:3D (Asp-Asp-Asp) domain-containing protein